MNAANLFLFLALLFAFGCNGEKELVERTQLQTEEQIQAENRNLETWSARMEADLSKRRRFVEAVSGEYEGEFFQEDLRYRVRIKITPTLPGYASTRVRTPEEVVFELQNLQLDIHVVQWNPEADLSAVGCTIEDVRPDLNKGILNIVSENCPNSYEILVSEEGQTTTTASDAQRTTMSILAGEQGAVTRLNGRLLPTNSSVTYDFVLERTK